MLMVFKMKTGLSSAVQLHAWSEFNVSCQLLVCETLNCVVNFVRVYI